MQHRVRFDFEIDFTNGGGIKGDDFRLDIAGDQIDDEALADYLVKDMRLLMVGQVRILNKQILQEAHKRTPIDHADRADALIDLSHTIESGLVTYKGLPAPLICDYLSRADSRGRYAPGVEFQIGRIEMVGNTGTYVDCPFHRYAHGKDLAQMPVERFAELPAIVVRAPHAARKAVDVDAFRALELRGRAVLVHTGWDQHWNTDAYFEDAPYVTAEAAGYLRDCGVALVGIDSVNIDALADLQRPVHSILLGAEILIVEHLRGLERVPDAGFRFSAVPPKFKGVGTFPVRAMARLDAAG
jgi:arylformamidase